MVSTYLKGVQLSCSHQLLYWQVGFPLQDQVETSHDFEFFMQSLIIGKPVHLFLHLHVFPQSKCDHFLSHKATEFFSVWLTIFALFAFSTTGSHCQKSLLSLCCQISYPCLVLAPSLSWTGPIPQDIACLALDLHQ